MSSNKKHKRKLLTSVLSTSFLLATLSPAFASDLNDVKDGSFRIGKDVYDAQSPDFTYDNVLQSLPPDNEQFYKFNSSWFNIPGLTQYDDLFNNEKAVSVNELKSWTDLDQYYKDSGTIEDFVFIKVESVSAINGKLTVDFAGLEEAPAAADFEITYVITADGVSQEGMTVTATDEDITFADGDVTIAVPELPQTEVEQSVVYTVSYKDAAAVSAEAFVIEAQPVDEEAPVFVYDGETTINLENGAEFTVPEVTATDNVDETVEVTYAITNAAGETIEAIDTTVAGTYTITYSAVDAAENAAENLVVTVVVAEAPAPFEVASVNAITSTKITAILAEGADATKAADKANYTVMVGDVEIPVSEVSYVAALRQVSLTVDLKDQEGSLTVNGIAGTVEKKTDKFDFKAPAIAEVKPVSNDTFDIVFSEEVDKDTAETEGNYNVVETETVTVLSVKEATLQSDKKTVRVTLNDRADKSKALVLGKEYKISVVNVEDTATIANVIKTPVTGSFTGIEDKDSPTVESAKAVDADEIEVVMSEAIGTVPATEDIVIKQYGVDGKLLDSSLIVNKVEVKEDKLIITLNSGSYLENGKQYNVAVKGGKDLSGNTVAADQAVDFYGVRDVEAPTVEDTVYNSEKKQVTITFSEVMEKAGAFNLFNTNTTDEVKEFTDKVEWNEAGTAVTLTLEEAKVVKTTDTQYSLKLTGLTDGSLTKNPLAANTIVEFTVPGKPAVVELTNAVATEDGNKVTLTFGTNLIKAEAENIANYSIVEKADGTKTLAVTKAVYNDTEKTVTLTTDYQGEKYADGKAVTYVVTVANLTNLNAAKATAEFKGEDKVAPTLQTVGTLSSNIVELTFDEKLADTQDALEFAIAKEGNTIPVVTNETEGVDYSVVNNKLRLTFETSLEDGANYQVTVIGVKDQFGNNTANDEAKTVKTYTKSFTAAKDEEAPKLLSATSTNANTIVLKFNEELDTTTAQIATNYSLTDEKGIDVDWTAGYKAKLDPKDPTVVTITDASTDGLLANAKEYTVKVKNVKDVAGNPINEVTAKFTGVKDEVAPKLVSATAEAVKAQDEDGKNIEGKYLTKLVLTFDEVMSELDELKAEAKITVTSKATFDGVTVKEAKLGEDKKTIEVILLDATNAGEQYLVKVENVEDASIAGNVVNAEAATATFTGVDTKAPVVSNVSLTAGNTRLDENNGITIEGTAITINTYGVTNDFTTGTLTISEDVKVTVNESPNEILEEVKDLTVKTSDDFVSIAFALINPVENKVSVKQLTDNLDDTEITLTDSIGNAVTYTIDIVSEAPAEEDGE